MKLVLWQVTVAVTNVISQLIYNVSMIRIQTSRAVDGGM